MAYAVLALTASTSRKSNDCASAIGRDSQCAPPSVDRSTVPLVPDTQSVPSAAMPSPRNEASEPVAAAPLCATAGARAAALTRVSNASVERVEDRRIVACTRNAYGQKIGPLDR